MCSVHPYSASIFQTFYAIKKVRSMRKLLNRSQSLLLCLCYLPPAARGADSPSQSGKKLAWGKKSCKQAVLIELIHSLRGTQTSGLALKRTRLGGRRLSGELAGCWAGSADPWNLTPGTRT